MKPKEFADQLIIKVIHSCNFLYAHYYYLHSHFGAGKMTWLNIGKQMCQ